MPNWEVINVKCEASTVRRFVINLLRKPHSEKCESFLTEVGKDVLDKKLVNRRRVVLKKVS